ncbi:MAG: 3-hydroxyacyl-ACP dehydratase FabZ [Desulfohalobiaceae bacterium]|nr:3-hydroxyacyl-ACP dehydratase FabZ [Desulfohalobiaceae bacterium]
MSPRSKDFSPHEVMRLLPHRYPFLLVDRIEDFEPSSWLTALKNVSVNEPFFQGHFPGYPVMPGVLIIEALAQAGGLLILKSVKEVPQDAILLFSGIEKARFRKPVYPGDQMKLQVSQIRHKINLWKMVGEAQVHGETAAQAKLTASVVAREEA